MDSDFLQAAEYAIKSLLDREFFEVNTGKLINPTITATTAIQALNGVIGLGGGHTMRIGNYWMIEYWPGIKVTLTKSIGEEIIEVPVPRRLVIQIAEKHLNEVTNKHRQLSLF